ncbi:MAG: GNAT family N-acetyltransferase [Verrucomicrobiales bacterium]
MAEPLAVDLASDRLDLPLAAPGDWREILPITSDEKNYDFELSDPDDRKALVAGLGRSHFPAGFRESGLLTFLVRRRSDGVAIGLIHLQVEAGHFSGYLGFMIHHPFQRQGYGAEALGEVLEFAFGTLNLRRVWSSCDARNVACIRLLGKSGFGQEGVMADAGYHAKRGWIDIPIFSRINRVGG